MEEPVAKIPKVEEKEFENVGANLEFLFKDQQEEKNESFWRQTNSREKVSEQKRQQKILKVRKEKLWFFFSWILREKNLESISTDFSF